MTGTNSDKYFINEGINSTGTYATAIDIPPTGTIIQTEIPNANRTYTIRFYNGAENHYKDEEVIIIQQVSTSACEIPTCSSRIGVMKL